MKYFFLVTLTIITLLSGTSVTLGDVTIVVTDSNIIQEQDGFDLEQEADIGVVCNEVKGNVTILIPSANIIQTQRGSGYHQKMRIGSVGYKSVDPSP